MNVVLVTGAAGHVGGTLVRALLQQGRHVRALVHRDRRALEGLAVETVQGDVCELNSLERAFAGADIVYHAAGHISLLHSDWSHLEAVNVLGTRNVIEACLRSRVRRMLHFSSIHAVVQKPYEVPIDEARPLVKSRGCAPYDRSKAAGEREVRRGIARGLDAVILSPTAILGPYDFRPSRLGQALLALAQGRLPALVAGGFDWVDARDVVEGALRAEQRAPGGAKYMLSGHWASMQQLAALAQEISGARAPRLVFPLELAYVGAPFATAWNRLTGQRPMFTSYSLRALRGNRSVSHTRATRDLGYHPRPLHDTLVDTFAWFAQAGRLSGRMRAAYLEQG